MGVAERSRFKSALSLSLLVYLRAGIQGYRTFMDSMMFNESKEDLIVKGGGEYRGERYFHRLSTSRQ